jgi:hypothetical protein
MSRGRKLSALLVEKCRKQFEEGEAAALLDAVDYCARSAMPLPLWAAQAFCDRYISWVQFRAGTLDEAFGVTRPKGKHTGKRATRERLRPRVVLCVLKLDEEMPLDEALFERVGAKLEISGSLARTIYYEPATGPWRKLLRNFEIS